MKTLKEELKDETERFYLLSHKWFESGVMREIYRSDSFCICNVLNQFYALFDFTRLKDFKNGGVKKDYEPLGTVFNKKEIEEFIKKPMVYYEGIYDGTLLGKFMKLSFKINDENLKKFLKVKGKYLEKPASSIDFEWESNLNNINKEEKRVNL